MDIVSILVISVALAMDAFSVSISCGLTIEKPVLGHYMRLALYFGGFQFIMPLIGSFAGKHAGNLISNYAKWTASGLLIIIAGKMIYEGLRGESEEKRVSCPDPSRGLTVIGLAVATSIDALAVGFSFGILRRDVLLPAAIIGLTCAIFSAAGLALGDRASRYFSRGGEILGGIMLMLLGLKIAVQSI